MSGESKIWRVFPEKRKEAPGEYKCAKAPNPCTGITGPLRSKCGKVDLTKSQV